VQKLCCLFHNIGLVLQHFRRKSPGSVLNPVGGYFLAHVTVPTKSMQEQPIDLVSSRGIIIPASGFDNSIMMLSHTLKDVVVLIE